jgi:hypothetical protein
MKLGEAIAPPPPLHFHAIALPISNQFRETFFLTSLIISPEFS